MQPNAFLALAELSGELKDPSGAGRARYRTPDEILREAREKHSKFKAFVTNGTFKPSPRVGLSRVQFGEGDSNWSVHDQQRFQESLKPPRQMPEMETPVQVTRTLSRTQSQGAHGFRACRAPQQLQETSMGSAADSAAGKASQDQQQPDDDQDEDGEEAELKAAGGPAAPAAAPALATLRSASSSFRYRSVLGSALEASQLRLALDRLVSEDGAGSGDRPAGMVIPTPPGRAGGLVRRDPSQGSLMGRGSLDGSWVAQLRGSHSFTAARRQAPGVSAGADGGGGPAGGGGGGGGVLGGRRPLREARLCTEGTEDGAGPAVRAPDSPGLGSPALEGGLAAAGGGAMPYAQRSPLGGGGSGGNSGVNSKGMAMITRGVSGVMPRGPSQTAPQLSLDLSSLELDPVPAKTFSPPAPGPGCAGGNPAADFAAAGAASSSGLQAYWTTSYRPAAGGEAGGSRQSPTPAARSQGSPSAQPQGQTRMAFPGVRGSLARDEQARGGSPLRQLPQDPQQRLFPQVAAVQEDASGGGAALAKPAPPGTPQPQPPCRLSPCPPATTPPAAVVEAAGPGPGAAVWLAPPLGPPRRSADVSSEQVARNAVLSGWSSRRRSERILLQNAGGGGSVSELQLQPQPQQQPPQQGVVRGRAGPGMAAMAVAVSSTMRAEGAGWAGSGAMGSSPGSGSDGGSFLMARDSDDGIVAIGSPGSALRRQVFGLPPGVSAAAGVYSLRTNSGSSGTTRPVL